MSLILGIDAGTWQSGFVFYNTEKHSLGRHGVIENDALLKLIREMELWPDDRVAIEKICTYGMTVGQSVLDTAVWNGRFYQRVLDVHGKETAMIPRIDVKMFLCKDSRAKDKNVRRAILDLFPAVGGGKTPEIGTKSQPGPLYGVKSHVWSALGIALTHWADVSF